MYTANLNSLAPETLKKCSCLLSYHFLLVRCQNVYFDGSHLENPIGPPIVSAIVINISELGSLVPKNHRKVVLFVIIWLFVGKKCKNVFSGGGHFESSNMATPLKIGFGSRQIWVHQVKMYLCTKFDAFVQICTFIPLTALTTRKILSTLFCTTVYEKSITTNLWL